MDDVNKLNIEFLNRINTKQKVVLNDKQLTLFGLRLFQIFKYKVIKIEYYSDVVDNIEKSKLELNNIELKEKQEEIYKDVITNPEWKIPKSFENEKFCHIRFQKKAKDKKIQLVFDYRLWTLSD